MWIMFEATFRLGEYPMEWIESFVGWIGEFVRGNMSEGPLKDLLVDGIIGGVGGVIVFLPNILILYAFISFMEDSGYMARAAFIMDKIMHKMGQIVYPACDGLRVQRAGYHGISYDRKP